MSDAQTQDEIAAVPAARTWLGRVFDAAGEVIDEGLDRGQQLLQGGVAQLRRADGTILRTGVDSASALLQTGQYTIAQGSVTATQIAEAATARAARTAEITTDLTAATLGVAAPVAGVVGRVVDGAVGSVTQFGQAAADAAGGVVTAPAAAADLVTRSLDTVGEAFADFAEGAADIAGDVVSVASTALGIDALRATIQSIVTMGDADRTAASATLKAGLGALSDADKLAFQAQLRETYNEVRGHDSHGTMLSNITEFLGLDSLKVLHTGDLDTLHTRPGVPQPAAPAVTAGAPTAGM